MNAIFAASRTSEGTALYVTHCKEVRVVFYLLDLSAAFYCVDVVLFSLLDIRIVRYQLEQDEDDKAS